MGISTIMYRLLLLVLGIFIPAIALAQGLVPCDGITCQACDILKLIQNLISFGISFGTTLSIITIGWTGFQMVLEGKDNPLTHSALRNRLKNIAIGFTLMLGAWIIVDTTMKLFLNDQVYGAWNKIQCVAQPTARSTTVSPGVSTATSGPQVPVPVPSTPCADCVSLSSLGMVCKSAASCALKPAPAEKLQNLNGLVPLRITEAYPPTATHSNACHYNATCVDATLLSGMNSAETIIAFMQSAANLGVRAVYEGTDCSVRNSIRAVLGASAAFCSSDNGYGHITGTHFSLYP